MPEFYHLFEEAAASRRNIVAYYNLQEMRQMRFSACFLASNIAST